MDTPTPEPEVHEAPLAAVQSILERLRSVESAVRATAQLHPIPAIFLALTIGYAFGRRPRS